MIVSQCEAHLSWKQMKTFLVLWIQALKVSLLSTETNMYLSRTKKSLLKAYQINNKEEVGDFFMQIFLFVKFCFVQHKAKR